MPRSDLTTEPRAAFATTHWSVIVAASVPGHPAQHEALASLCRSYWRPVYGYIRRRGHKPEDAQDLTQEFFARLLAKEWLTGIEPNGSRFRSFLLTTVSRFLANQYDHATALKRGGGVIAINLEDAEEICGQNFVEDPEREYDRRWAITVMDQALSHLREECRAHGRGEQFEVLSRFLSREAEPGEYEKLGTALHLSSGAVGVAVLRLRRRYREIVRSVIGNTVKDPTDIESELRYLIEMLRS